MTIVSIYIYIVFIFLVFNITFFNKNTYFFNYVIFENIALHNYLYIYWTLFIVIFIFFIIILAIISVFYKTNNYYKLYRIKLIILIYIYIITNLYSCIDINSLVNNLYAVKYEPNILLLNAVNYYHPLFFYINLSFFYKVILNHFFLNKLKFIVFTIFLGSYWAFQEGNWGGWWNWDISETFGLTIIIYYIFLTHNKLKYNTYIVKYLEKLTYINYILIIYIIMQLNFTLISHNFGNKFLFFFKNTLLFVSTLLNFIFIFIAIKCIAFFNMRYQTYAHKFYVKFLLMLLLISLGWYFYKSFENVLIKYIYIYLNFFIKSFSFKNLYLTILMIIYFLICSPLIVSKYLRLHLYIIQALFIIILNWYVSICFNEFKINVINEISIYINTILIKCFTSYYNLSLQEQLNIFNIEYYNKCGFKKYFNFYLINNPTFFINYFFKTISIFFSTILIVLGFYFFIIPIWWNW